MAPDIKKEKHKQEYEKPRLRVIELAADEVMATGCKTDSTASAGVTTHPPCLSNLCVNALGS